jgi:SSS family solute:Na+ symporter
LLAGTGSAIGMWLWVRSNPSNSQYIALSPYAKPMAENMFRALWSACTCVVVTVVVSLMTKPRPDSELVGLVYGCTPIPSEGHLPLWQRPIFWAGVVSAAFVVIQIIFW